MEYSIRCAYVHGASALRTHIDSYEGQAEASWEVFAELRAQWSGRITLQAASLVPIDVYSTDYGRKLADLAAATEGGVLGGVLRLSHDHQHSYIDNIGELLDAQFNLAKARRLSIDLHVDETLNAEHTHLEEVARAVMRHGLEGRVVCGHCCSLSALPVGRVETILALCAQAGIGIVSLPASNLYLQDRALGRTPRLRGVTLVHEIGVRKIPLAIASDNVRDSFYPFGDYDMLDAFRLSVALYHLDQSLGEALQMIGPAPARMMGVEPLGSLSPGAPANLILLNARSLNEIVCRPQAYRVVLNAGGKIQDLLPPFPQTPGVPD
jgi:cytosine deaminase